MNFVLVGCEEQVTSAFKSAGWLLADKTNTDAVVSALIATLQKNAYVTVPMSTLYLFGRAQDYGYARADAGEGHRRARPLPHLEDALQHAEGETLWAGAGTHDIGIEKDQRKENAITHKIDPGRRRRARLHRRDLAAGRSGQATGYMTRPKQIKETKTATGGEIKWTAALLVIVLNKTQKSSGRQSVLLARISTAKTTKAGLLCGMPASVAWRRRGDHPQQPLVRRQAPNPRRAKLYEPSIFR